MAMGLHASSRRRGRSGRRAPVAEINVTPLVDVMLVLLIIFMVTAPMLASGVPVELPDSRANALDQQPDQVTISIDRQGFIFVDDSPVEEGRFPEAMERVNCSRPDAPLITLRADKSLDYGRVMAVMGELNRAGCNSISLVTQGSVEAP
ncbi:MAG: ExbD/TolR family protein [Porphyrobacter sp.]|jgi:biopolymer transport protein TolR|uniref:ExbD/TolR family protein n=1 Tax=Croceibacterium selenioxidans TaxID=2838833 RepID=A0ABS5VZ34_9SPHN|nr:ExbD/TolR family protein [Croceibacterium selenioxidans]MBO9518224.1 ExbD/TolR family protein [Porphyrobacter sp.]MBT2132788.1 ExbD/TolR family protein [Croceibacterium selenioxidans]